MPRTIRWKLILSISVPLLVTYLGMLAWDYSRQRSAAMEQMQKQALERAESTAANLDARLHSIMQLAHATASALENRPNIAGPQLRLVLTGAMRQNPWVSSVVVATEPSAGNSIPALVARRGGGSARISDFGLARPEARAWYERARSAREAAWVLWNDEPGASNETTVRRAATYVTPVIVNEQFNGVVAVSIPLSELRQLRGRPQRPFGRLPRDPAEQGGPGGPRERFEGERPSGPASRPADEFRLPPPPPPTPATLPADSVAAADPTQPLRDFAILDGGGYVIVAPADAPTPPTESIFDVAGKLARHELADAARDALAGESRVVRVAGLHEVIGTVTTDRYHWIALAAIPSSGWALVSVIPESETMAPILARIAQRGAFLLAGSLVLLVVVLLVSIRISRPIEQMAGAVDRLAAGDLDAQVTGITSRDELGRLAGGFNQMTRQLKSHVAALTEQTAAREKVESELRIARQIQTDMLPKTFPPFPDRPEFDLHAVNLPASRVAGDFYDFFFTPSGLLTVVIADVSGKGVPAALLMAVTRTIVRNLALAGLSPAEIAGRANTMLIADTSGGMFVTMLLCQYDPATGRLTYVNAGHPPPQRLAPAAAAPRRCCDVQSPLLGVDASGEMGPFEQSEEILAPGESIFLYTDGVTDARAPDRRMFGEGGLLDALRGHSGLAPEALCRAVADHLEQFQAGQRQDDITLLVLRRSDVTA